ncbi:hypothetical protein BH11ARM2_BH11ARM2_26810 [soil metagenome]
MTRSRRPTGLAPNPFVAFADLTIALAFIFALCTFAFSKALSDLTRDERQNATQSGFQKLVAEAFPRVSSRPVSRVNTNYDRRRNLDFFDGRVRVGGLTHNGSYQRIELSRLFGFGQAISRNTGEVIKLGRMVQAAYARGDITYVFLHAIVEEREGAAWGGSDRALARTRADWIFNLWRRNGIIAAKENQHDGRIDPQYVVFYGKEDLYRNAKDQPGNPLSIPGRVDIVLFFPDKAEKR